jgi:hypothetical protein
VQASAAAASEWKHELNRRDSIAPCETADAMRAAGRDGNAMSYLRRHGSRHGPRYAWWMDLSTPVLRFFADAEVQVDRPQEVGRVAHGIRRVIPILGGRFAGDGWTARILPGGADFQLLASDTLTELDARYVLETDAGDFIYVHNRAVRSGPPELMARLARGEPVDASQIYFRCSPSFETASKSLSWINERMFVGTGARYPDRVDLRFFELA